SSRGSEDGAAKAAREGAMGVVGEGAAEAAEERAAEAAGKGQQRLHGKGRQGLHGKGRQGPVGEGTAVASKAEGETAAEAAGRAIARPVGAAGAAANAGKHTAGPAGPAETAKGASSKAAAGGVGSGDIGATGEGRGECGSRPGGAAKALAFLAEPCSPTPTLLHGQLPSPSPTPDPTVAGGPPGEHAAHLCPHPQGLLRAPRGAARALVFLEEPCSPTPTNTQPPPTGPLPPSSTRPPPTRRRTAPTRPPNRLPSPHHPPQAAETHPQGLAPQAHGSGGTRVEGPTGEATTGPTQISLPPPFVPRSNLHTGPAPRPPPPTPSPGRVPHEWPRWAAITPHTQLARSVSHGGGCFEERGDAHRAPPAWRTTHPPSTHPFGPTAPPSFTNRRGQPGWPPAEEQGQRPDHQTYTPAPLLHLHRAMGAVQPTHPHSAPPVLCPPPRWRRPRSLLGGRAVGLRDAPMADATDSPSHPSHPFHVDDPLPQPMVIGEGQGGLLGQGPHPSSAQPARPTPPSTLPALLLSPTGRQVFETPEELGASLPTPMETDRVLRPCHSHLDGVAPPPVQPVAQEVTSSRDEASAPTETPPPGLRHRTGTRPGPILCDTTSIFADTPPARAGEPSPPLIPGDPLGAQAAHGVPSTASSDATAPIDPADTATSPDQVVSLPHCRSSLANRRALQHHIPFCHPADAARRAQAAHDTASIIPSLSQPRATGMQFTDAQWQTLDSVDWTEYFSPGAAILVRIAQDPEAAGPTFLLAAAPTLFLVPATPPDRSHTAAIAARISRFGRAPRGSSGGPSGWVAEHLRDTFLAFPQSLHFLLAVYQQWLRGRCAPAARSLLASSTLVALAKSNMDVRPIAIGEVLVRILSRAVCLQLRDQMARVFLASQQFGVGVMCGTEVVVRGVRRALADHPDWVVLQLDVANAFNSFHRDRMFQALQASPEFQCLIPFIGLFYGTPSDLHYRSGTGVVTMHSERGTRQGDPLSPFLYALTQRLALEPVLAEGDVQLWSYADDTYVLGPPDRVLHHFAEIVRRLGEMGLAAQPHKCLVYQTESFLSRDLEAFTGLGIEVARRGLTVTGVPVGTVSFVEQSLPDRLERMGRVLPWLPRLRQPQTAARLLSACVSTRPQYLSRTVPPSPAVISSFTRWDARLGETFQQLLASGTWACREDVREAALDQIFLPIRLGGFGIRRMARIAPVSFVCSWVQCAPILCSLPACGEVFRQSFASGEPEQIDRALQTALEGLPPDVLSLLPPWPSCASASPDSLFAGASRLLEAHALEAVRARHASPLHLARLTSLQGGGAGAWLTSVPYADPLRIPEALWQAASSSRLGLPIPQLALAGQCSCGQAIDDMTVPHHAVRCPRYGVATTIHDTVKYMLRDFAVEAGFAVKVEDSTLFTQLEAARARLLGQPVVGEGTRAEGPGERRGEAGQPGGGGQWGRHQLRGQVERGTGGQRGRQGEQTGQDGEGGRHRQQQESQWRPRAQGAAPPGSASGAGQGREQQRADGGTGGAAGLGGEGQGVREAAGDGAGGSGGLGRGLMVLVDVSIADPQREGNVQLRRATPTQIGVAAARRVQEKLRHWGPHLEGLQPAPHFYACVAETFGLLSEPMRQFLGLCAKRIAQRRRDRACGAAVRESHPLPPHAIRSPRPYPPRARSLAASFDPPCPPRRFPPPAIRSSPPVRSPRLPSPPPSPPLLHASSFPSPTHSTPCPSSIRTLPLVSRPPMLGFSPPCPSPPFSAPHLPPLPAPPLSPPCPWLPTSLPHLSPLCVLSFSPPCPSLLPALPLVFRPPTARFLPSPRLPFFLRASPLLPPCPRPAHAPVFGFSPPCPTFLPSLPTPSAPPFLFPPCPSLPPPLPFALPSLRSLLPIPAALLPPSAHPHHQPPSHPSLPPLPFPLSLSHTHTRTLPSPHPPPTSSHSAPPCPFPTPSHAPHLPPPCNWFPPYGASLASLAPLLTLCPPLFLPSNRPHPPPAARFRSPPPATVRGFQPPNGGAHGARTSPSSLPFPPSYFRIQRGLHLCIPPCQALRQGLHPLLLLPGLCRPQPPSAFPRHQTASPSPSQPLHPCSCPLCPPTPYLNPPQSPPSPTPSIFPPPWGSPIRSYHPSSFPQFPLSPVSRPRILFCIYHSASFRCPLCPPTFSPPASQPSHYPLPGSRQLDYPLPFAPSSLFPTLPFPLGSTCPPPPPVEFCPALPTSGPPPVPTPCSPTATSPPPPHLHYSPPTLPLSTGPQPAPPLGPNPLQLSGPLYPLFHPLRTAFPTLFPFPQANPPHPGLCQGVPSPFDALLSQLQQLTPPPPGMLPLARGELAADTAREGVSEFVCEGAAEAAEDGAAKAAREGAMGVVGEGAAEAAEERAAEAAREGAAAAARERAAGAAREGAAGTVTLARQRAEAMETGFAGVGATEPAAVSAGGTAAEEAIGTAPAGKGVTGTGARESAAPAVAREGTAGARVGEGTAVASKAEGEAAAEAAGRAIARPVGAAGAAANAGKHTAGPAGPAETAKGASSKAAAGGVGSGDIGATGEGEVSVVPTGVGTEEGDVIAIEEDEGEDVMHIDGPLAQYLTLDGEADPAPLQPHVEIPPLPPMPVPMLAEGPMEGLGETLRTEPREGAPILTSRPPAHPPPGAPLPHPHPQVPVVSRGAAKALAFLAEPGSPTPTLLHGQLPSPSPTPDPTVAGGPPGEHAAHLCPHPQGLLRAPRGAARALVFLEEPCSPTPTNTQPPPTGPLPPPPPGPPPTRRRTAPTRPPNRLPSPHHPPQAAETHPQGLAPQAHGSGGTRVEGPTGEATTGPTQISLPPPFVPRSNLHTGPTPRPPPPTPSPGRVPHEWPRWAAITPHTQLARSVPTEGDVSRREGMQTEHPPPGEPPILPPPTPLAPQPPLPSQTGADNQVAAAAIATGREAVGLRDAPMADATDSPSHPSHPFHVDDPLPQPMVIGEGQGGLLGQGPHPSSAQPARPTPPSTLPALLLSPTGRQVFETPEEVRAGISDLLAIHRLSSSPAAPTLPVPQDRTRTYAEVTRSVPSFIPPATQLGASLPTPMETDRVLRPCHSHLDGVAPPPVQPVAQEVTSSRDEASAPTETPPPGVAEPSLEPHPAEGQEHTTAHTSGSPPRPPSPASTPVPARGPALSCATPPLSSLTPPPRGAGEPSPPLIPGDPLGAQAAHGVPSTASSDATAPIDPADTATSPDQVVSCPTCRSSLANRRALQHHIPFCHPADAARRAQAAHDTASIIPSLSQPRATGMQFTDAQWQTLDSVDWTEYFSPERIHTRPLRRVPERVRGGYLDVLSAILVRIAQDPEAAGPTFLLAAAPTLFLVPATPPDRSHTAAIAARISRFGRGEWAELVSDALGRRTPLPRRTGHRSRTATDPSTADERRIARCLRLAACNETSRACAALESAEAAPDTQGTIQRLQSKHPNAERPTPAWLSGFQGPLLCSRWITYAARFSQLRGALREDRPQWLRGRCAPAARSLLASSTLVALAKSNMDVRPIAIGEVLVRILSRAVCLQLRDQMARVFLASQQFGVGVMCGTEVVVRGVRRALADHPDWVVLQLDVANAFNSFHRDRMFQALQASPEFQCLIPFIGLFYGTPSDLHYRSGTGVVTMHSERGTRQGDPLSPFLYALTQRLALEPVLAEGDVQLWSYADDTYVLGPPDRVLHHFAEIVRRLGEMGLAAQPHKCLVYQTESFLSRDLEAFTGLGIEVARRGLTVTGVPVGTVSFVEQSLPDRLERMGRVLPWLPRLRQPQTAARLPFGVCQHSSAVPVEDRPSFARSDLQFYTVGRTPGRDISAAFSFRDLGLSRGRPRGRPRPDLPPIRLGGFGIRRMARIAPVSFVCSWVQCAPILCSLPACGEVFRQSFASGEPEQIDRALQTALEGLPPDVLSLLPPWPSCASASPDSLFAGASRLLEAHALEAVRARHASPLHLARLTSLQGGGAGAWLTSVPYADPLRIPEALWQAASSSRLGLPIPQLALAGTGGAERRGGTAGWRGTGGRHQLRGQVERGTGGQRGRQGEQTGQDGEGGRHRQQQESQWRPRAQGAAPPGSASGAGQGREQQRADGGTGGAAGLGGEGQGVREAAGDGAGGSGGLGEGREGEGRGQVDGGEERGRETIGEGAPRDQTGQQPAQQQGPVGRTGRVGTASRIPDLTCRDVGQGLMVLVDVSIADPQREGNVQLRRATPTQIGVAAARRVQEKLRHWGPHLEGLQPAPHFYATAEEG
ncbi:unnamed protein product, partial [Closterium sp. NIES-65]